MATANKPVELAKLKGALAKDAYKVFGTPSKKLNKLALPTKNAQAFCIGHVLCDMGLEAKDWPTYINLTGLLASSNEYGLVTDILSIDKVTKVATVKIKAQPYCEAHHHHVFLPNKQIGKGYAKAVGKTVEALGGDFGKELVTVLNEVVPADSRKQAADISRIRKALPNWQSRLKK